MSPLNRIDGWGPVGGRSRGGPALSGGDARAAQSSAGDVGGWNPNSISDQ